MPSTVFVSNEHESADEQRQQAREEALFLYSNALLRKDFDAAATILSYAEIDSVLEGMILGLSPYLEAGYLLGADASKDDAQTSGATDASAVHGAGDCSESDNAFTGFAPASPHRALQQLGEDFGPISEGTLTLESEWQAFVGAASEATTRLYALYLTAMDHLDRSEYHAAAQCADDAVLMALQIDDLEAAAECLCLYGIIEGVQARYGTARTLFRIGLLILDQAESGGAHASDALRVELQTALSRLDDRSLDRSPDTGGW